MHIDTGEMFEIDGEEHFKKLQQDYGNRLVALTDEQAVELKPLSRRKRKALLKSRPCICGSGKSFKKCCSKKGFIGVPCGTPNI